MTSMEYDLFERNVRKLKDFCREAGLNFRLDGGNYPVTLTLTPGDSQTSVFDASNDEDPDARMVFALANGEISVTASGGFTISDTDLKKILALFTKISAYWVQYIFRLFATADTNGGGLLDVMAEGVAAIWRNAKERANVD